MENFKKRVLIVEDDKLLALVEERLIERLGYEVAGNAATGEDALKMIEELDPDILVVDISLKGEMDGVETVKRLRKHSSVPVIFLSGNSDKFNYERARKVGFVDYLVKPVTAQQLESPLQQAASEAFRIPA